jgi:hypothetical protein
MQSARRNILVVYALCQYPVRATIRDHLYSFRHHSSHRYFYVNVGIRDLPRAVFQIEFDAVIFHTSFLSMRWSAAPFAKVIGRAQPLKHLPGVRLAIPQDEFLHTDALSQFITDFRIDHVFTAAAPSEWSKIYATVDRDFVSFTTVLTGYLEDKSVAQMTRIASEVGTRSLDIGYRAWRAAPWLGRHGVLKAQIADVFASEGRARGLTVDISTRDEDTLYGDDWYRFLARSKYTIGVEGGASVLDRDGSLKAATERYVADHPLASFDEIEAHCFPDHDGYLALFALSPRHLEACVTRTCQVLIDGEYNGVLHPGEHYIALRPDFSNLHEVLDLIQRDTVRESITANAWRDVVASGLYTYRTLVDLIERAAFPRATSSATPSHVLRLYLDALDRLSWIRVAVRYGAAQRFWAWLNASLKAVLPAPVVTAIQRFLQTKRRSPSIR